MSQPDPGPDVLGVLIGIDRGELATAVTTLTAALPRCLVVVADPDDDVAAGSGCEVLRLPVDEPRLRDVLQEHPWVVIHDPACPQVRPEQIRELARQPGEAAVVMVQPVLETLKLVRDRVVVSTVDRERLRVVTSPMAAPGATLAAIPDLARALRNPEVLVSALRDRGSVGLVEGPHDVRRLSPGSG